MKKSFATLSAFLGLSLLPASAAMVITEWMYNGMEFVEFTNTGSSDVDMTGWSFSDSDRGASSPTVDLSGFGVVGAGKSVILSEVSEADFRAFWGGLAGVAVIGDNSRNLGRSDELNLYDNLGNLADRLTFGDQAITGSIRTDGSPTRPGSGVTTPSNYQANDVLGWTYSTLTDGLSFQSTGTLVDGTDTYSLIGSPGVAAIPEASSLVLCAAGALGLLRRRRRA